MSNRLGAVIGLLIVAAGAGCQTAAYAQEDCPPHDELEYFCHCSDVKPDLLYSSKRHCWLKQEGWRTSTVPQSVAVRPSGNSRAFILVEPMTYEIGTTGVAITVPAGFVTDYASIPERLWGIYSPHDQYSRAAVIHDYLYWSQLCTRLQADNLFMIAMKESDVPKGTRDVVYLFVRAGGDDPWEGNSRARRKNVPKVVPLGRKDFPPNWDWEKYRDEVLVRQGVNDPPFTGNDYCVLGDTTDVPTTDTHKEMVKQALARPEMIERDLVTIRRR